MSEYTLQFPAELEKEIGLNKNEINSFKGLGCRFYRKKTCVAWVREFLAKITATESESEPPSRLQRSIGNKSGAQAAKSGSRAASPALH